MTQGEYEIKRVEYGPWLLGFCRWARTRRFYAGAGVVIIEPLAGGSWRWRGRRARYREVIETSGRM